MPRPKGPFTDGPLTLAAVEYASARFWCKVRKTDGCWLWIAGAEASGYGAFGVTLHRRVRAHVVSMMLHLGTVDLGACVLHKCDNPPCVNPEHLFLGSRADNMADKKQKGRQPRGEACPNCKLRDADIVVIRASTESSLVLGKRYGVTARHIRAVRARKERNYV